MDSTQLRHHFRDDPQDFRLGLSQQDILTLFDKLGMTQELENDLCSVSSSD
jgi:hypothetical protein